MKVKTSLAAACAVALLSFSANAQASELATPSNFWMQGNSFSHDASASCPPTGFSAGSAQGIWEDLMGKQAAHSLTLEDQESYLEIIQTIWPGVYSGMQADEVSDEMAGIVDAVLREAVLCSGPMTVIHFLLKFHRRIATGGFVNPAKFIRDSISDILKMIKDMRRNRQYRVCINTAAWNWRSTFEMAYWDY